MPRAVITGIGVVGPTGTGHRQLWQALISGEPSIGPVTRFDTSSYACKVGGQVPDDGWNELIDPRKVRTASHATCLALAAGELALRDAALTPGFYPAESFGTLVGTALGGWSDAQQQYAVLLERGARRVNPFIVSGAGNHGAAAEIAGVFGAQGYHLTVSSGCPSGVQAIGHAAALIANGELDMCLAGGTESPLSPLVFAALCRTQELSTHVGPDASRPFDVGHAGMVLSEGSCLMVLENAARAKARGATVYAEILGSTSSCDAQGMYGVDATGRSGARAIDRLLRQTSSLPTDLDYVCAHANSSPAFDRKEVLVLNVALGEFLAKIPVSSIKGVLGHPFGASGAFQTAVAALAIREQRIPPTHNLQEPDPACDLNHVRGAALEAPVRRTLVTSYGYGGVNAYLLLGQHSE
jgi:3-oxoacyl-[acyl-carrier-protein] synthase II